MSRLPIIEVTACSYKVGPHAVQLNDDKNARAVATAANGLPLILPMFPELLNIADMIDGLDGLFFTGSPSNIEPHHYDGPRARLVQKKMLLVITSHYRFGVRQ